MEADEAITLFEKLAAKGLIHDRKIAEGYRESSAGCLWLSTGSILPSFHQYIDFTLHLSPALNRQGQRNTRELGLYR